jgi:glycosyltransferase
MLRMLYKEGLTATYLPRVTVKMKSGGQSNVSLRNRIRANREDRQAWALNDLKPSFLTFWWKPLRKLGQFLKRN